MDTDSGLGESEEASVVRIEVPNREAMNELLREEVDLAEYLQEASSGVQLDAVVRTTELKWFAVDAAGNMEGNYNPHGKKDNYRRATFTIR